MDKLMKVNPNDFGVEETKAKELTTGLIPHLQERKLLIQEFEQIKDLELNKENCEVFKTLRLKFQKNRTQGINDWHKKAKEIPLRLGQLIDAVKRNEISVNQTYEDKLEKGEKHFENLEKERLRKLQSERVEMLSKYVEDANERDLSSMDADVWEAYLSTKKQAYEARIEAERKAEAERLENERLDKIEQNRFYEMAPYSDFITDTPDLRKISEKEYEELLKDLKKAKLEHEAEQKRIQQENERLRKEAEAEKARRAKIEADRKAKEEKERKAREEKEKAEREAYESKLRKEREERERVEKELKAKAEAEAKAKAEAEAKKEAELKKGDADKFNDFISDLESLKTKYQFRSKTHQKKYADASTLIDKIINHINK
jgi:murein DD-endopeptidase MepM/ murein hydrolase activator NlpD